MKTVYALILFICLTRIGAQPILEEPGPKHFSTPSTYYNFRWSAVAGATSYRIQFDSVPTFTAPIISALVNPSPFITNYTVYGFSLADVLNPGGRYFWRVSSSIDPALFSTPGEFTIGTAPFVWNYKPNPTSNRRPSLSSNELSYTRSLSYTIKVQVDDNSDFSSPITSELIADHTRFVPQQDLPYGRIYWRKSTSFDTSQYSQTQILDIDAAVKDRPTLVKVPSPSKTNRVELIGRDGVTTRNYQFELDTSLAFASPPKVANSGGYRAYILTDPLTPGKKYWRASAYPDYTYYSLPDSFEIVGPELANRPTERLGTDIHGFLGSLALPEKTATVEVSVSDPAGRRVWSRVFSEREVREGALRTHAFPQGRYVHSIRIADAGNKTLLKFKGTFDSLK